VKCLKRLDSELFCQFPQLCEYDGAQRDTVFAAFYPSLVSLFSWNAYLANAGQFSRAPYIPNQNVNAALEFLNGLKASNIEGGDRLARIGRSFVVMIEVNHAPAKNGAIQSAGQQAEDERRESVSGIPSLASIIHPSGSRSAESAASFTVP
jgi:hypothetical protein